MQITNAEFKVIRFSNEDVITTSNFAGPLSGKTGLFYIPSSQYQGGALGGDYVAFNGTLGNYDGSAYRIDNPYGFYADTSDERSGLTAGGTIYIPELGITVPSTTMKPLAETAYDAFTYDNGTYYTNGVSYYDQYWQ